MRRPVVGVMGSGRHPHDEKAEPLGLWLAKAGVHLLTGGGGGVMAAVSRAFSQVQPRDGLALGVLPGMDPGRGTGEQPAPGAAAPKGYPNRWVELVLRTHLPRRGPEGADVLSRNHVNVLSADVIVALPGGPGTSSEAQLALRYGRPIVAFLDRREQIPDLPSGVPWTSSLEQVQEFVLRHIQDPGG